jgi:hypothetical protein
LLVCFIWVTWAISQLSVGFHYIAAVLRKATRNVRKIQLIYCTNQLIDKYCKHNPFIQQYEIIIMFIFNYCTFLFKNGFIVSRKMSNFIFDIGYKCLHTKIQSLQKILLSVEATNRSICTVEVYRWRLSKSFSSKFSGKIWNIEIFRDCALWKSFNVQIKWAISRS